jgi:hypothetical protein
MDPLLLVPKLEPEMEFFAATVAWKMIFENT